MIQVMRDADHTRRGLKAYHSGDRITAGGQRDDCRSVETLRSADVQPCRGLRDRGPRVQDESADGLERDGRASAGRLDSSLRSKDDNFPARRGGRTTFGEHGRQNFGFGTGAGSVVMQNWRGLAFQRHLSQDNYREGLMTNNYRITTGTTHMRGPMGSGIVGGKVSVTTTKNDNMRNRLHACIFWPRQSGWLMHPAADSRRARVQLRIGGREAGLPRVDEIPACHRIVEEWPHQTVGCHGPPERLPPLQSPGSSQPVARPGRVISLRPHAARLALVSCFTSRMFVYVV